MGTVRLGRGVLFVVALAAEIVVALGVNLTQNDSAAKIANGLHAHETALTVIACLSIVYAVMFVIYLSALHNLLRGGSDRTRALGSLVLVGGVLFVTLHGVSDIGVTDWLQLSSPHTVPNTTRACPTRST